MASTPWLRIRRWHLGLIVPVHGAQQGGREAVRPPLQFDGERAGSVTAAPLLDQHGAAIRAAVNDSRRWPAADIAASSQEEVHVHAR
jgi:hypothetical protein